MAIVSVPQNHAMDTAYGKITLNAMNNVSKEQKVVMVTANLNLSPWMMGSFLIVPANVRFMTMKVKPAFHFFKTPNSF